MSVDRAEAWIEARPERIRKLCREFPIGTRALWRGVQYYLIGYGEAEAGEDDMVIFSTVDPIVDYDAAVASPVCMHAKHLRECFRKVEP